MFHHKKHSLWQRLVMATRDLRQQSECQFQCPGCDSGNTSGEYPTSWACHNCGAGGSCG